MAKKKAEKEKAETTDKAEKAEFDPAKDKVLVDLGLLPDSKIEASIASYDGGRPRLRLLVRGKNRTYPARTLSAVNALDLAERIEKHRKAITEVITAGTPDGADADEASDPA